MYESPVKVWEDVAREIVRQKDEYIFSQIRAVVDVDREELLKALKYDRQQYEKGYSDGVAARDAEIVRCEDCKYGIDWDGRLGCEWHGFYQTEPNWFCADGERK